MEEEIAETETSLDEKEEEREEQKEDLPSNDSNSLTLTLYDYPQCVPKKEENYIVEFVHDTTEIYYERGKYSCGNFHVTKTPLILLKVWKLLLSYLPMIVYCASLIYFFTRF